MNNGKTIRVLVIDDDQALCETLQMILEPQSFEVFLTSSAKAGIEMAKKINPDIIILDLHMPEVDGLEATATIRSFSQKPILVLSSISKPDLVVKALDHGADDYLLKPVPNSVLIAHLNRLARRVKLEVGPQNST